MLSQGLANPGIPEIALKLQAEALNPKPKP